MALIPLKKHDEPTYPFGFDEFDRVFDNLFKNALTNLSAPAATVGNLAIKVNISETDKAYHVEAELPGMDEKDIELTVKDGVLNVSGEKEYEREHEGKTWHRVERSYGSFRRSLQLPADADENMIEARMKNGILEIEIGKNKEAHKEPKRIDIRR